MRRKDEQEKSLREEEEMGTERRRQEETGKETTERTWRLTLRFHTVGLERWLSG